jgi:hypothetical protein
MVGCGCLHEVGWHGASGCGFPGCDCTKPGSGPRPPAGPAGMEITRCSECNRRPTAEGGNHADRCSRRGELADAPERRQHPSRVQR